jgi:hypothetical protein
MEHEGQKDLKRSTKWIKGTKTGQKKKKFPPGAWGMDVCVVFVVRTVAWNVK